jgi:hypothetical protein
LHERYAGTVVVLKTVANAGHGYWGARLDKGARPVKRSTVAHTSAPWITSSPAAARLQADAASGGGSATATLLILIDRADADLWPGFFNGWRCAPGTPTTSPTRQLSSGSLTLASLDPACPAASCPDVSATFATMALITAACGGLRSTPDCQTPRASAVIFVRDVETAGSGRSSFGDAASLVGRHLFAFSLLTRAPLPIRSPP